MLVVSGCQGSGSSFILWCAKKAGWRICKRPDKPGVDSDRIYRRRMQGWGAPKGWRSMSERERAVATIQHLRNHKRSTRALLLCASWGHQGFLRDVPTVYLIRHPVHAYVSYLGGGWLSCNRSNMGELKSPNDSGLIEAWLYGRNRWIAGTMEAMAARERGMGHIVRYDNMVQDWQNVPMPKPPIAKYYKGCSDDWEKTRRFVANETINAIMKSAGTIWDKVCAL